MRWLAPQAGTFTGHGMYQADPDTGYRLRPDHRWGNVQTNAQGLRDIERAVQKPSGVRRVLVLGDSFAFGSGMRLEDTFARQLQTRLADSVDVVNAGVPGFSTVQQRAWLEKFGLAYEPDVVVVAFFVGNDLWENLGLRRTVVVNGELAPEGFAPPPWWRRQLRRSHLYRLIASVLTPPPDRHAWYLDVECKRMDICADPERAADDYDRAWQISAQELRRIRDAVAPRPVVVLAIPDEFQVNLELRAEVLELLSQRGRTADEFDFDRPQRLLRAVCEGLGLQYVDPLPELRRRTAAGEALYLVDDSHWNAAGNALGAETIATAPAFEELRR